MVARVQPGILNEFIHFGLKILFEGWSFTTPGLAPDTPNVYQ